MILVSSCLLGVSCRYDGGSRPCQEVLQVLRSSSVVPVCPEQLGGLPTPRHPATIMGGDGFDVLGRRARVVRIEDGVDVTEAFIKGAKECVNLVKMLELKKAFLKARSPSCGLMRPIGVTAAALLLSGMQIREF